MKDPSKQVLQAPETEEEAINQTVELLIRGGDYRQSVINNINVKFFDYCISFFKKIIDAKFNNNEITLDWYKANFINKASIKTDDFLINSGINRKTVSNIYGTARKEVAIDVANNNIEYLESIVSELDDEININISLEYNDIQVSLNLTESLIVINALATKKIALRGSAWSSIGKKAEKPLVNRLCDLAKVPMKYRNSENFVRNPDLDFDREIDYVLYSRDQKKYNIEVKLMGRGNPESADATIARNTHIFIADTLSEQNKAQLADRGVQFLQLKNNPKVLRDFIEILSTLDIPHNDNP